MLGRVFLLDLRSFARREGAKRRSRAAGPMERIDCSNSKVKSHLGGHPCTTGPNTLSLVGRQVDAMFEICCIAVGRTVDLSGYYLICSCKVEDSGRLGIYLSNGHYIYNGHIIYV